MFYNILNSLWEELARFRAVIALERPPGRLGIFGALWVALSSKWTSPHNGRTLPPLLHVSGHVFRPNLRGAWKRERVHLPPETRNLVLGVISASSKSNTFSRSCTQGRQTPFHPGAPLAPLPPRRAQGPPGPLGPWGGGGVGYLTSLLSWTHGVTKVGTGKDGVSEPGRRACAQA